MKKLFWLFILFPLGESLAQKEDFRKTAKNEVFALEHERSDEITKSRAAPSKESQTKVAVSRQPGDVANSQPRLWQFSLGFETMRTAGKIALVNGEAFPLKELGQVPTFRLGGARKIYRSGTSSVLLGADLVLSRSESRVTLASGFPAGDVTVTQLGAKLGAEADAAFLVPNLFLSPAVSAGTLAVIQSSERSFLNATEQLFLVSGQLGTKWFLVKDFYLYPHYEFWFPITSSNVIIQRHHAVIRIGAQI